MGQWVLGQIHDSLRIVGMSGESEMKLLQIRRKAEVVTKTSGAPLWWGKISCHVLCDIGIIGVWVTARRVFLSVHISSRVLGACHLFKHLWCRYLRIILSITLETFVEMTIIHIGKEHTYSLCVLFV